MLVWHAKERTLFMAEEERAFLHPNYQTLRDEVGKQLKEDDYDLNSLGFARFLLAMLVLTLAFSLFFAGLLSMCMGLVNSQQLITHLPLMAVGFPANAMAFIRNLMAIVMLDLLEVLRG
jgi:hypothetical protein